MILKIKYPPAMITSFQIHFKIEAIKCISTDIAQKEVIKKLYAKASSPAIGVKMAHPFPLPVVELLISFTDIVFPGFFPVMVE